MIELNKALDGACGKKVLIVGDLMVDQYILGDVKRVSPEAPVLILNYASMKNSLGASANIAKCIVALGGKSYLTSAVGADEPGLWVIDELKKNGINNHIVTLDYKPTTIKTRVVSRGYQLIRIDKENNNPITASTQKEIIMYIKKIINSMDAVIFSDYEKGFLTPDLLCDLFPRFHEKKIPIVADVRSGNLFSYYNADYVRTNLFHSSLATGINMINETSLRNIGLKILSQLRCKAVVITRGKKGLSVFKKGNSVTHIPATEHVAVDVSGAGDVVTATLTLALSSGIANILSASKLANLAGGIKVTKFGVTEVYREEVMSEIRKGVNRSDAP